MLSGPCLVLALDHCPPCRLRQALHVGGAGLHPSPVLRLVCAIHLDLNERSAGCCGRTNPAVACDREWIDTLHDDVQAELQLFQGELVRDCISDGSERMGKRGPGTIACSMRSTRMYGVAVRRASAT